ncbi:MAG: sulfur carrier protein ThiS [Verrucomicrobia bacterium]|nr:MAG: sulfur carrier protein ThiS [Verrucomicrobiota bacterium]TAE88948.1 MAG: sulfur carrier protein ThiS [Verrucomicrobiota bacterium]TAF27364.1 MAG: sulfur carrier protein ThiS [Verrucomicrobiota bacterium]TAF42345.1 MAG: sulfur carrier protein ThiS [Verrucomicrobiota bacterium]
MTLQLNGESRTFSPGIATVSELLAALDLTGKPLVVELDHEPVFPADYEQRALHDGAILEIVVIAAGG